MRARLDRARRARARATASCATPRTSRPSRDEVGGFPVVLKTVRGGYDGKGVWVVRSRGRTPPSPSAAGVPVLAEEKVDFVRELAANVVRSPHGQAVAYPVVETRAGRRRLRHGHRPGARPRRGARRPGPGARPADRRRARRRSATSPSSCSRPATAASSSTSWRCARTTPATGPRTARSPASSRNHVRAVLDLPLGDPRPRAPWTVMVQRPRRRLPRHVRRRTCTAWPTTRS